MTSGRQLIDDLRSPDQTLDQAAVQKILPYGQDFLFVDRVSLLTTEKIEASFQIPAEAPYLRSHFVDIQLMPGVLLAEGLGQAASLIVRYGLKTPERQHVLGLEVERAQFPSPALPGDTLGYRAEITSMNRRTARFEGEALVDERLVCKARVSVVIVSRRLLERQLGLG